MKVYCQPFILSNDPHGSVQHVLTRAFLSLNVCADAFARSPCHPRFRCTSSPDCYMTITATCTITSRITRSARAFTQHRGSSRSSPHSSHSALCHVFLVQILFFSLNRRIHIVQTILFSHESEIFSCVHAASLSDFVFIQGTGVIFKVALCLLSSHEGEIMECDSFESIVDYLKSTLPALSQSQMEQTIAKV